MRKIIISISLLLTISCQESYTEKEWEEKKKQDKIEEVKQKEFIKELIKHKVSPEKKISSNGIKIVIIDSCEYILYPQIHDAYFGSAGAKTNYTTYSITHKGDCKHSIHKNK